MDRFSPVCPAHIRVLVLPVGQVERSRYLAFLDRLRSEASIINLADLEPYVGEGDATLSPKAFPQGWLLYNYTTSVSSEHHQQLSPFELFREPLLVLGVKDGFNGDDEGEREELRAAAEYLRERHSRVVHRQLLVLRNGKVDSRAAPDGAISIGNVEQQDDPSLRDALCQFSARFLAELATYSRAMQASPGIQTPGQTARSLQRTTSLIESERAPAPGRSTPPQSTETSSPVEPIDEETASNSFPRKWSPPAQSFDQIPISHEATAPTKRPESGASNKSKSSARASSQDRISVQGFGSATSQEKLKNRGKARVGIVMGSIYMLAGQWGEAMRTLVEHTGKARMLADQLWYAKGLENIVVCMLLHAWAGLDFQIPSVCYPNIERSSAAQAQRFSVNIAPDVRPGEVSQAASLSRLSTSLPDLLKFILNLYRAGEGSLELPFVLLSEVTVRFCKLLAVLDRMGGELDHEVLDHVVGLSNVPDHTSKPAVAWSAFSGPSKYDIADMLSTANPVGESTLSVADHASILSGLVSVYALLQMHRKKAATVKDLLVKLTSALMQARKRGAAEMGIHPAASLSAESGADTIISIAGESGGITQMMSDVAAIYGIPLPDSSMNDVATYSSTAFGSDTLKLEVLRALSAFCEASPDPYGVLRLNTSMLRCFGPSSAVDPEPIIKSVSLSREEQVRCITAINRNIGISKLLGLPKIEAAYWDDFLIREIEFIPAEPGQAVIDLSKQKSGESLEKSRANPLLYNPNASHSGTESETQTHVLVENEMSECRITLQNPFDVSVDVESLRLIAEGVELKTSHERFMLSPLGIQRVSLSVSPTSKGDCKVTGCLVKLQGCKERRFSIVTKPWAPPAPVLVKEHGQECKLIVESSPEPQTIESPEFATVAVSVIESQPALVVESKSIPESKLMLLDGEIYEMQITLRNSSKIAASIFDIATSNDAVQLQKTVEVSEDEEQEEAEEDGDDNNGEADDDSSETSTIRPSVDDRDDVAADGKMLVEPGASVTLTFDITGKPTVSRVTISVYYSSHSGAGQHARILSIPLEMTVNASLQVQRLEVLPLDIAANDEYSFVLSFDVSNAWPKSLFYSCFVGDQAIKSAEPRRCHNHEGVLAPSQAQRVFMPITRPVELAELSGDLDAVRKALVERLRIIWSYEDRMGEVDVSNLSLSPEAFEVVVGSAIYMTLQIADVEIIGNMPGTLPVIKAGSFTTLEAKLYNRAAQSYPLVVQMQSRALYVSDSTQDVKRIAVAGASHRLVPTIGEGETKTVDFAFCPLLSGMIELEVVVKAAIPGQINKSPWISRTTVVVRVT